MLFNSLQYLLFLPIAAVVLFVLPRRFQWLWLLACSTYFYATLSPRYLILFAVLALLNYVLGRAIEEANSRKGSLFRIGVVSNVLVLAFFKYFRFLEGSLSGLVPALGGGSFPRIFLPVGLSFQVLSILSYLIEVKKGTIPAEKHLGIFATGLFFFPKIMQGPIERPCTFLPQFGQEKRFDYERVVEGLRLVLWGYFKKLVVADRVALYVDAVYGNVAQHNGTTLLAATFLYSFQIYADFSGYSDIAIGSARILGFKLTNNFNRPYFSTSVKDFWNRWHISFSTWLRDYLFLPLAYGFSRRMQRSQYLHVATEKWIYLSSSLITFAICGIWHGEGSNFLLWGLLFGVFVSASNWTMGFRKQLRRRLHASKHSGVQQAFGLLTTFLLVSFAWVFFRSNSTAEAVLVLGRICTIHGSLFVNSSVVYSLFAISVLTFAEFNCEYWGGRFSLVAHENQWVRMAGYAGLILMIVVIGVFDGSQFIYLQF